MEKYSKKCAVCPKKVSPEAMACLVNYDWPGNVRELENAIERALVIGSSDMLRIEDLPEGILEKDLPTNGEAPQYHTAIRDLKKQLILKAMEEANSNYTEAAQRLGIHVNYLHRLIRTMNLRDQL
jgi:Nif-specific regulatory protein